MKQDERTPVYTEGVCGDGAMILRDGQPFPISSAIDALNACDSTEALRTALAETLGDLLAQLEWETGLTDTEIRERPSVIKARAALSGSAEKDTA